MSIFKYKGQLGALGQFHWSAKNCLQKWSMLTPQDRIKSFSAPRAYNDNRINPHILETHPRLRAQAIIRNHCLRNFSNIDEELDTLPNTYFTRKIFEIAELKYKIEDNRIRWVRMDQYHPHYQEARLTYWLYYRYRLGLSEIECLKPKKEIYNELWCSVKKEDDLVFYLMLRNKVKCLEELWYNGKIKTKIETKKQTPKIPNKKTISIPEVRKIGKLLKIPSQVLDFLPNTIEKLFKDYYSGEFDISDSRKRYAKQILKERKPTVIEIAKALDIPDTMFNYLSHYTTDNLRDSYNGGDFKNFPKETQKYIKQIIQAS